MSTLELHLRIAGVTMLLLAAAHPSFARHFQWRAETRKFDLLTRQVFWVHLLFICLLLVLQGVLLAFFPRTLLARTELAQLVAGGLAIFWIARLIAQWLIYDQALWRGNRFHTVMHLLFSMLWMYYALVFSIACWRQM
ncbi:MAG TPA: hypothetical protein VIL86_09060 [Tepidisphaeraceae bacterium]|jgi:hypothetical protein